MNDYPSYPPPVPARPARGRLTRSRDDKMVAGVCGGLAQHTGLDANLIRIVLVAVTILGLGSTVILYLAAWLLMPRGD